MGHGGLWGGGVWGRHDWRSLWLPSLSPVFLSKSRRKDGERGVLGERREGGANRGLKQGVEMGMNPRERRAWKLEWLA